MTRRGVTGIWLGLAAAIAGLAPAAALDPDQREQMKQHFASLGRQVKYELFAPLGGPEVGAVLLDGGGSADELRVLKLQNGGYSTLFTGQLTNAGLSGRQPFTFLQAGRHLLTYPTLRVEGPDGRPHEKGDLAVYDLSTEGAARLLFTLPGVQDLGIQPASSLSNDNLLRQPAQHFLNYSGRLPLKYDYYRLSFDPAIGQYRLYNHLTPLPDTDTNEAANSNNRAIADYYAGRLMDAARGLEKAVIVVESSQTTVYRNQNMVKSELDDLAAQGRLVQDLPSDDALLAFWQGDFNLVLRVMELRQSAGYEDADLAMLGIALANTRRWPEADKLTAQLASRNYPFIGDYAYELVKVAEYQALPQVVVIQLKALERVDPGHPGLTAAKARILRQAGQASEAERLLRNFLNRAGNAAKDLGPVRLELYRLLFAAGDQAGCDALVRETLTGHGGNLRSFVTLADYIDFSGVYTDVPLEERDRIKAPSKPLEYIGEAPPGFALP